jgi:hypothetical protein
MELQEILLLLVAAIEAPAKGSARIDALAAVKAKLEEVETQDEES